MATWNNYGIVKTKKHLTTSLYHRLHDKKQNPGMSWGKRSLKQNVACCETRLQIYNDNQRKLIVFYGSAVN